MPEPRTVQLDGVLLEFPAPPTLHDIELAYIPHVLAKHGGDKGAAAEELGISRRTLYNKLRAIEGLRQWRSAK